MLASVPAACGWMMMYLMVSQSGAVAALTFHIHSGSSPCIFRSTHR